MPASIVGFCRFSFFGPSDTKLSYDDRRKAFDTLYAPDRMETRFRLFEKLFLPSLRAQSDPDFRLYVLSSLKMPKPYRTRLAALCATVPQIELVFSESETLGREIIPITSNYEIARHGLVQFRCDDDDALGRYFIERLRFWQSKVVESTILSLPKGLMLCQIDGRIEIHPMHRPLTGAGFAFYTQGPVRKHVFQFAHLSAGRRYPVLSDPSVAGFIQTFTDSTDTAMKAPRKIRHFLKQSGVERNSPQSETLVNEIFERDFPSFARADLLQLFQLANRPDGVSTNSPSQVGADHAEAKKKSVSS